MLYQVMNNGYAIIKDVDPKGNKHPFVATKMENMKCLIFNGPSLMFVIFTKKKGKTNCCHKVIY